MLSPLARYQWQVVLGIVCLVGTSAMAQSIPWLLKLAIDALGTADGASRVGRYAALMVALAVGQGLVRIASRMLIFDAARSAEYDVRNRVFEHLLTLPPAYFRRMSTGDIMTRLSQDVQTLRVMWGPGLLNVANTLFVYGAGIALMASISPSLTLWALLPYPVLAGLGALFARRLFRLSRQAQDELGRLSGAVQEDLAGIAVIKTYALEEERGRGFAARSRTYLDTNLKLAAARGQMMPVLGALGSAGTIIVLWLGGRMVARGELTLGALIAFNAYLALLIWPTLALGWILSLFQRGMASWTRVRDVLGEPPRIVDGAGPPLEEVRGALWLRGLTVEHDGRKVVDGVTLDVPAGSTLALVGRTGSGKSTLAEAVCRLVELPPGMLFLDGRDVTTLPLPQVRGAIGYAPQEAFLFSATIAENIAFGRRVAGESEAARDAAVGAAAEAAGLARDLAALPDGLATVVGERGITLSGGQRQRVALARALAAEPRILVLDDSLSSVDAHTEREILGHLDRALAGRTAILISHRVAAVARAHKIVVLDEGRVAEAGTHAELIGRGGIYAELYRRQLAEEGDDAAAGVGVQS